MTCWLVKSEPSSYSWDQLVQEKSTAWTGVRNAQARANLQAMKVGDQVLFYHSNVGLEVVGIARVSKAYYLDPTDKSGKFGAVDIAAVKPLKEPVSLHAIKAAPELKDLALVRNSRLSVQPVSDRHLAIILKMAQTRP